MKRLFLLHINLCENCASAHLIKDIIRATLESDASVDVICRGNEEEYARLNAEFFDKKVNFLPIPEEKENKNDFLKRYISQIKYSEKTYRLYKKNRYDSVFLQSCNAAYFFMKKLKKLKCPVIFNVQDIFPYNLYYSRQMPYSALSFPIFKRLQNKAYNAADFLVTVSSDMKNTLVKDGVPEEKIGVIYNWSYSDDPVSLDDISEKNLFCGFDKDKFNVVYAGNIGKMQNVKIVIEAAKALEQYRDIRFNVIGEGVNKAELIKAAEGLDNVSFFDMQPADAVESIYAQADLNVITLADGGIFTALPSKTATCLRADSPCAFCIEKNSEFAGLIGGESGVYVCENKDAKELTQTILYLKDKEREKYSRGEFIKKYMSSKTNPAKYAEIIKGINEF